jgi:hypothetical protein
MPYRHPAARIHEIVQAPKVLAARQCVEPKKHGSHGLGFEGFCLDFSEFLHNLSAERRTP